MANKVGPLIKEARTNAGLTQEQLSKKLKTVTAAEISRAERGELEFPQTVLKEIAKLTGVTQKSLVDAAKESTYGKASAAKTSSTAKKPAAGKTASGAKTSSAAKAGTAELTLSEIEKTLVRAYRKADADTKKTAIRMLKGEKLEIAELLPHVVGSLGGLAALTAAGAQSAEEKPAGGKAEAGNTAGLAALMGLLGKNGK